MPSKIDSVSIKNEILDRRVKLTSEQKEEIYNLYQTGNFSLNGLAKVYGVSKKTIHMIVKPEKLEHHKAMYKERRKDGRYYDKSKHTECNRNYRNYKRELVSAGLI